MIIAEFERPPQNYDDDGLYIVDKAHLIFSYDAFFHSTMPDPDPNYQGHLNDRVAFDGYLFSVDSFQPRGRVADQFLTVSADLRGVAQEDMDEDTAISMFSPYLVAS